jgi:uncharacterized membrane protein
MTRLRYLWEELNASFWFIPMMLVILAIILAVFLIYLDQVVSYSTEGIFRYLLSGSIESARSVLTIIAGAMIGVASTVFSITLVALTMASSQLGSRLLRNFMYDRLNQVVLGTYVATFVYCLLILNSLIDDGDSSFIPAISIFTALIAALASIILLIVFIHHISVSIQSDNVISDIAESLTKNIRKLFPAQLGQEEPPSPDMESLRSKAKYITIITYHKTGYLQSINGDYLMDSARKNDITIIIHNRPGDYVISNIMGCEILSNQQCRQDIGDQINKAFIIGKIRTPFQDAEYSIRQMVEIASRALSPGINDPYTAITCIDNLTSVMCYLAGANYPDAHRYDQDGNLRVVAADQLTFEGMIDAAFNQIRQFSQSSPAVLIRLMEAMISITRFTRTSSQRNHLLKHAKAIMHAAEKSFSEPMDITDMQMRYQKLFVH